MIEKRLTYSGLKIGGMVVNNLKYVDTTLVGNGKNETIKMLSDVKKCGEEAGLYLNLKRVTMMATGNIGDCS